MRDVLLQKDEVDTALVKNVTAFLLSLEGLEADKLREAIACHEFMKVGYEVARPLLWFLCPWDC